MDRGSGDGLADGQPQAEVLLLEPAPPLHRGLAHKGDHDRASEKQSARHAMAQKYTRASGRVFVLSGQKLLAGDCGGGEERTPMGPGMNFCPVVLQHRAVNTTDQ